MQSLGEYIETCTEITTSKGFDVSQHGLQSLLIIDEVVEAQEHLVTEVFSLPDKLMKGVSMVTDALRAARKASPVDDKTTISDENLDKYIEEYADIIIRVFSYIGGNGWKDKFLTSLDAKIETNKNRPPKHNKEF
jgi:hypothetical protein